MDHAEAQVFAERWVRDWNAHDVDALLKHFAVDVVFTSPVAIRIFGGDGVLRGRRPCASTRPRASASSRTFTSKCSPSTSRSAPGHQLPQPGRVVSEVLTFEGPLVKEGHGTYLTETPVGLE